MKAARYSVVIPTLVRPQLMGCLEALAVSAGPPPDLVVLVDDRPEPGEPPPVPPSLAARTITTVAGGRGPAAARNRGWRLTATPWVVFLDDDVLVDPDWAGRLATDLLGAVARTAGVQGRIRVPLEGGRPTDWARCTAGLEQARWITADIAYRREALVDSGGFDERFPRAFREDADLALRLLADGWDLTTGRRGTAHPVRPAPWSVSVRTQRGNADDALMRAVHGPGWHERAGEVPGRRARHLAITAAASAALVLAAFRRPRQAVVAALAALAGIGEFAAARIAPGPRDVREVAAMLATSAAIPPAASWHWTLGLARARRARAWPGPARALLLDRDGTLIRDVPYNGDPGRVVPLPGARAALDRARAAGLRIGVVSNQSGLARGAFGAAELAAVNARVEELLGPFDVWRICPHDPGDACLCRKPAPGLIVAAAEDLGLTPAECVVIGDIGADVAAARAAGARSVLVPTPETRPAELIGTRCAPDLAAAVAFALARTPEPPVWPARPSEPEAPRALIEADT